MPRIWGFFLAGAILAVTAGKADAQVAVSVGNPFYGNSVYAGAPAYGGYGVPAYGYGGGYRYNSGYAGYAAPAYGYGVPAYRYPYRAYRPFGLGRGFRPYRRGYW